jgi:hypothetical protein
MNKKATDTMTKPTTTTSPATSALALLGGLLALGACDYDFVPVTKVDKLHLLAVRADPPEIAPLPASGVAQPGSSPDRATLTSLVADPRQVEDPARQSTVVYLACTPDPTNPAPSPCADFDLFRPESPALAGSLGGSNCAATGGEAGTGILGGVSFTGIEACDASGCRAATVTVGTDTIALPAPRYILPAQLRLDALPPGMPARLLGVEVKLLALAIDARPEELAPAPGEDPGCGAVRLLSGLLAAREHVFANKSITVRGPEQTDAPNVNPVLAGIRSGANVLAPADGAQLPAVTLGASAELVPFADPGDVRVPPTLMQAYTKRYADGSLWESAQEDWTYSWYSTAGEFADSRTREPDAAAAWSLPAEESDVTRVRFWVVVRDLRGGTAFARADALVAR